MKRIIIGLLVGLVFLMAGCTWQWSQVKPRAVKSEANVQAEADVAKVRQESAELQTLLSSFQQRYPEQISLAVVNLENGASAYADADKQMVSASLYKLFVAFGVYQLIDSDAITSESLVKSAGTTVDDCLDAMITVSDNLCGKELGDLVGWQQLDDALALLGFSATKTNNYTASGDLSGDKVTSARDVGLFMQLLFKGELLSKTSTDNFITLLKAGELNTWLPSGLPEGTEIAHKTGTLYDYVHDAGIVYASSGAYLVVMMTHDWQEPAAQTPPVFAEFSSQLWSFFVAR